MNQFFGKYLHSIDPKGRVAIPSRLRKNFSPEAGNSLVLTKGSDSCIYVYPKDIFGDVIAEVLKLDSNIRKENRLIRNITHNVHEEEMDGQSRIILPQPLKQYASIENEVLIAGSGKRIELWNPVKYEEYLAADSTSFEELQEQIALLHDKIS
ncbi:MAG: division/cell wall cluster transcriptional repressor MraZ [Ignavibacteriaceae bacterium]|nr:division/cell wall cluster transcriptional repressor MraZ [Ignavibacteriaceae bacterium]